MEHSNIPGNLLLCVSAKKRGAHLITMAANSPELLVRNSTSRHAKRSNKKTARHRNSILSEQIRSDMTDTFFPDLKTKAVFGTDGPKPQFLIDTPQFKALVVGLEAGGRIPAHPGAAAVYHFIEGEGVMTVEDETFAVKPGVTLVAPSGTKRGVRAETRLVFLGAKGE